MIKLVNVSKIFKSKNKSSCLALNSLNLTFENEGFVFIVGKSGSGKSTLLSLIGGLDNLTSGDIFVNDTNINKLNTKELSNFRNNSIGFVFQDYHLLDELTIFDNVKLALDLQNIENDDLILESLEKVGLKEARNKYPKELSGGEKQRIAIARALVKNPKIILADEPTGNLDSKTSTQILDLLNELSKTKLVLIVSHNRNDAIKYADRIVELEKGEVISDCIKNNEYKDEIEIKNDTLFLPINYRLTNEEKDFIHKNHDQIKFLDQKDNKFIETDNEYIKNIKIDETKEGVNHLKFTSKIKLGFKFLRTKLVSTFVYSFIIASVLLVSGLSEQVANFDSAAVLDHEMANANQKYTSFSKTSYKNAPNTFKETNIIQMKDEDFQIIENGYKGKTYRFYNTSLPISDGGSTYSNTYNKSGLSSALPTTIQGTLVTNEDFVLKALNIDSPSLEFVAKSKDIKDYGVYITDLAADSILISKNNTYFEKDYDAILGDYIGMLSYNNGYINGIIKTNYREKYGNILAILTNPKSTNEERNKVLNSKAFHEYLDIKNQFHSISYSFNENYIDDFVNDFKTNYFIAHTPILTYNDKKHHERFVFVRDPSAAISKLKKDECYISYEDYEALTGINVNESTVGAVFKPIEITFSNYDYDYSFTSNPTPIFERKVKVVDLCNERTILSKELVQELRKESYYQCGVYFDSTNIPSNLKDTLFENGFTYNSSIAILLNEVSNVIVTFEGFFNLILVVLCIAIILLLISYSIKIVKDKKYEIGVIKALGSKNSDLITIFGLHQLTLTSIVLIIYNSLNYFMLSLGNSILIKSISIIRKTDLLSNLELIILNPNFMIFNSVVIILVSLISFLVSMIKLHKVKPLEIIKAKE